MFPKEINAFSKKSEALNKQQPPEKKTDFQQ